jgi:hypothetical protein
MKTSNGVFIELKYNENSSLDKYRNKVGIIANIFDNRTFRNKIIFNEKDLQNNLVFADEELELYNENKRII